MPSPPHVTSAVLRRSGGGFVLARDQGLSDHLDTSETGQSRREDEMALEDGYGVVIGTLSSHGIEDPDEEGRWPHYKIFVEAPRAFMSAS
jgi:hypothetical protein